MAGRSGGGTEADDLPDWLRPSGPPAPAPPPRSAPPPPAPPPPAPPPASGAAPNGQQPATAPAGLPPADAGDLPPWLRDESGQPLPTAGALGETNLPEWLRGAPTEPSLPDDSPRLPPAAPGPMNLDWFGEEEAARPAERAPGGNEFFGSADLPAWLRVPESEPSPEMNPADARSLDWLTRLGSLEEESNVVVTGPGPRLAPPPPPVRTSAQLEALALLRRLAADPFPDSAPVPAAESKGILRRIGFERALYVALLVAVLLALLVPLPPGLGLQAPPVASGAEKLFQQIDTLTENDVVLVGYEWDARRISEMRPLERAVIGHLIQKQVKLVLVSTDPQGALLLFDLRDELKRAGYREGGESYILLGYKPGSELALRLLAQDFRTALMSDFQGDDATVGALAQGSSTGRPLSSLGDLSMMLVLADDASDVQGWMEQVHTQVRAKPLAFLLPEETAPIIQPYLQNPAISHLAGKQGALAYQYLSGADSAAAAQILLDASQQRASLLLFVILFAVGALGVTVGGATARRRGAA